MVENDKSVKCTKFRKIDQNVDYVSMWCGRRIVEPGKQMTKNNFYYEVWLIGQVEYQNQMIRFSSFDDIRYYVTRGVYDLIPSCKIEWDANIQY